MARRTCPSCGAPFDGKKCRSCCYEVFNEEFAHGTHTHQGEPLVINAPTRAPIPRQNPFDCPPAPPKKRQTEKSASRKAGALGACIFWMMVVIILVSLSADLDGLVQEVESSPVFSFFREYSSLPEPEASSEAVAFSVLYRDDTYTIGTNWGEGSSEFDNLQFSLEHTYRREVILMAQDLVINGYSMDSASLYLEAKPKVRSQRRFFLNEIELERCGIETIQEFSFSLVLVDAKDYDTLLEVPERFTFTADIPSFVQEVDDSGLLLLSQDGVKVIYRGYTPAPYSPEQIEYGSLDFFLENNTDEAVFIEISDITAAGQPLLPSYGRTIEAHTRRVDPLFLMTAEELDAETPEDLEPIVFHLNIYDSSYHVLHSLESVSVPCSPE